MSRLRYSVANNIKNIPNIFRVTSRAITIFVLNRYTVLIEN